MATAWTSINAYVMPWLLLSALAVGCQTSGQKKEPCALRLHLEVNPDGTERNKLVSIGRAHPFQVNVEAQPFLDENAVSQAWVVDALGGFQLLVQFDRRGTWLLEQYSTANRGKRVAICADFGQGRWLAAPVLTKRVTDGTLVFTPDATREEAERIAEGLNQIAKEVEKGRR